ncbi:MAG: hypothetical protein JOZ54_13620, partial [Acidobacteria bacterium]|nr:hypothetical protein [Acidobacteriota bacterium]
PVSSLAQDVVSNGDGYLVATSTGTTTEIVAVANGDVRRGMQIASARSAALASNGRDYLLVYVGGPGPAVEQFDVFAQRLDRNGLAIGERILIERGAIDPVVASNGERYAVGTFATSESFATIVGSDGTLVSRSFLVSTHEPYAGRDRMAVASDGRDFLFAWVEGAGVLNSLFWRMQTFTRRIFADGHMDAPHRLFPGEAPVQGSPSLAWIGDRYLVTFDSNLQRIGNSDLAAAELAPDGAPLRDPFTLAGDDGSQSASDVAWNGHDAEIVYVENGPESSRNDIRHLRHGASESALLSESIAWQDSPAAAALPNGGNDLVVWSEQTGRDHRWTLFAARANADSGPLDGRGVELRSSDLDMRYPVLSAAPQPLAVWVEQSSFSGGNVFATLPFTNSPPAFLGVAAFNTSPAAAWDGATHTVVWETSAHAIVGRQVIAGSPLVARNAISLFPNDGQLRTAPQIAGNGERFLVAWRTLVPINCPFLCPFQRTLDVATFDASLGAVGAPTRISEGNVLDSRVVWNGSEFVVFFIREGFGLFAQSFDANGLPMGGSLLAEEATKISSAVWDGGQFVVGADSLVVRADRNLGNTTVARLDANSALFTVHGDGLHLIYQKRIENVMRLQLRRWNDVHRRAKM